MRYFLVFATVLLVATTSSFGQPVTPRQGAMQDRTADQLFPPGRVEQRQVFQLDAARSIRLFDATPNASHWLVISDFANWQRITIDGRPIEKDFHEISTDATRISPNGSYVIWTGLLRAFTRDGFDSTTAFVYHGDSLVAHYVADYPMLQFSRTGARYAVLLPYAYQKQKGDRDLVIVDDSTAVRNEVYPHQFAFSHDETQWGVRSSDGETERLITSEGKSFVLYKHKSDPNGTQWDPTIWRYTPDVKDFAGGLPGRDFDMHFTGVARQYRTAYSSLSKDTARTWIQFGGKRHDLYRWINNVVIDTAGRHIAYFACDPSVTHSGEAQNEHKSDVVYDGKIVAGPYPELSRLFLSPSGKHIAYTLGKNEAEFYLDTKLQSHTSQVVRCVWSPDEKKIAYVAVGEHDKYFVVVNGKRSPLCEFIGRVAWDPKGRFVEFAGVTNARVTHFRMPL
jgi:hypothetical protein